MGSLRKEDLVATSLEKIPLLDNGCVAQDLYIFLPSINKFIVFITQGDQLSESKKNALKKHPMPSLFIKKSSLSESNDAVVEKIRTNSIKEQNNLAGINSIANLDSFGQKGAQKIKELCGKVLDKANAPADELMDALEVMADDFIDTLVPDVKLLKETLIRNLDSIGVINDCAAISSIACVTSLANGIESQKIYRDIFMGTLLMDYPLNKFSLDEIHTFYIDPLEISAITRREIQQHPKLAYKLVSQKMTTFSEHALEIILNHHERFNGSGYPRGISLGQMSLPSQIVSFAVDIFENLRAAQFTTNSSCTLKSILEDFSQNTDNPDSQKHNPFVVSHLKRFLSES